MGCFLPENDDARRECHRPRSPTGHDSTRRPHTRVDARCGTSTKERGDACRMSELLWCVTPGPSGRSRGRVLVRSTGRADARWRRGGRAAGRRPVCRVEWSRHEFVRRRSRRRSVGRSVGRSVERDWTRLDSTARDSDGDGREGQSRASTRTIPSRAVARCGLPERLDRLDRSTRARRRLAPRQDAHDAHDARARVGAPRDGAGCPHAPLVPSFSGFRVEGRASRVGAPLERATRRSWVNRARRSVDS